MSSLSLSARTILGPLTTTFTPAPSCTIPVIACSTCNYGWGAQTCFSGGVEDFTGCWPATGTSANLPSPTQPLWGWGFYSPGLVCPQGYASACSATATNIATGTWTPQWSMSAGETAVGCCPRCVCVIPLPLPSNPGANPKTLWKEQKNESSGLTLTQQLRLHIQQSRRQHLRLHRHLHKGIRLNLHFRNRGPGLHSLCPFSRWRH
jgi:hypothetical protein